MSQRKRFYELSRSQSYKRLRLARNLVNRDAVSHHESAPSVAEDSNSLSSEQSENEEAHQGHHNVVNNGPFIREDVVAQQCESDQERERELDDLDVLDNDGPGDIRVVENIQELVVNNEDGGQGAFEENGEPGDIHDEEGNQGPNANDADGEHVTDEDEGSRDSDDDEGSGDSDTEEEEDDDDDNGDSDHEDDPVVDNNDVLKDKLALWILKNNISREATKDLLKIIRCAPYFQYLPKTREGLVHTSRDPVVLQDMPPGKYYHFGLEEGLRDSLFESYIDLADGDTLSVMVNCDGVSLNKSNFEQFFTLLGHASNLKGSSVFKIGMYHGTTKPESAETFLRPFVTECCHLIQNNVAYQGKSYRLEIEAFICDLPAQAFILNVKGHAGFSSCTKCTVVGRTVNRTSCFYDLDCELRTDASFRAQEDEEHHNGVSPIIEIPGIDMIKRNPKEPFHLKYVGTMKKVRL
ncbi:hypothetical protein B566_EDAN019480 [Ephemera danica]|nr:hypothetical protein B566_EDAN019480 [Ephemera danica]